MGNVKFKKHEKILVAWLNEYAAERNDGNDKTAEYKVLIDKETHQYQLLRMSWDAAEDLNVNIVFHFDIKNDGKIWIYANNTDVLVAKELMKNGLSNTDIVLGFYPSKLRQFSEYAVA